MARLKLQHLIYWFSSDGKKYSLVRGHHCSLAGDMVCMAVMDNFLENVNLKELVLRQIGLPKTNFISMVQVLISISTL